MDPARPAAPLGRLIAHDGPAPAWVVLDLGGVLLGRARPALLGEVAEAAGVRVSTLDLAFDALRHDLWRGRIGVAGAWETLTAAVGAPGTPCRWVEDRPPALLATLPAVERVPAWAARARVAILSNHRAGWVRPLLAATGVLDHVAEIWISSETGNVKPETAAFAPLRGLGDPATVLYVDDQMRNLREAAGTGVRVLPADGEGRWAGQVDAVLGLGRPRP